MSVADASGLCKFLDWDSTFFGKRIARVMVDTLDDEKLAAIESWRRQQHIDCLYFLARSDDTATVRQAEGANFHLVDMRLTLQTRLDAKAAAAPPDSGIRPVQPTDGSALKEIARVSHTDTRFYYDDHFPRQLCDKLYEIWIAQSCNGSAAEVLVAEFNGEPVGYITCELPAPGKGQIGLLGVSEKAQGQGLGTRLIAAAMRWFPAHGATEVTVVTQARNIQAQRVYQKNGFRTLELKLWYHRWFS